MDPSRILPEEVWDIIINMLTGYDERLAAYNTCQMWRSFSEKSRIRWMFQEIFPLLFKYLPKSDILNGRLVCKQWNKAIISYLESGQPSVVTPGSLSPFKNWQPERALEVNLNACQMRLRMPVEKVMEQFQTDFGTAVVPCAQNPFVSRSLNLTIFNQGDLTVYDFLDNFGVHIWSLRLSVWPTLYESFVQTARFIYNILRRVPNLKKLVLTVTHHRIELARISAEFRPEIIPQLYGLRRFIRRHPVPCLHQLENLELKVNINLLDKVLKTAYAPRLNKYVHDTSRNFIPNTLTNLEEAVWDCVMTRSTHHLILPPYCKNMFLTRLHIRVERIWHMTKNCRVQHLFKAIECHKNTLVHLSLDWPYCKSCFTVQLDLPFVKGLILKTKTRFKKDVVDLSFLVKLKSLQKLTCAYFDLEYRSHVSEREEKTQKWSTELVDKEYNLSCGADGKVSKGNIWQLLPTLVEFEFHQCFLSPKRDIIIIFRRPKSHLGTDS